VNIGLERINIQKEIIVEALLHTVEVNIYYKEYKERIEVDVISRQK